MQIAWLQSFVEAAKKKSLTKAASTSNISQPALSKHINNLESYFNVKLFHRTTTGIELTEAGEHLYTRILPVIAEITAVRQELRQFHRTAPIVIGSLPSLATYYLPPRIKGRLSDQSIKLMIQNTSEELVQSLQEGRLDAILVDTLSIKDSLCNYELFIEPYYAVFPLDHPFRSRNTVELSELCKEPLIVHQAPCDTRKHIIEQMELLGHKPNIVSEVAFGDFIFGAVSAGMGITITPKLMAKNIGHQQVFGLPITNFGKKRSISLATKNSKLGLKLQSMLSS